MYLTCPRCETVYAVRAAMLKEGQGEVRCGACQCVFNALDCLSDELPTTDATVTAPAEPALAATLDESDDHAQAGDRSVPGGPAVAGRPVPDALRADLEQLDTPPAPATPHAGLWVAAVVLLLALAIQYLWFAPQDLSRRFPMFASAVQRFCLDAGCMTRTTRAPERIRIVSRDVRAHPRYEGALLVTATFSNTAPWPQPFPRMRFSLYNVNGQTIAARVFEPVEYLAGVLPSDAALPPGQPVQVALEMLAPEDAAVSFEFTFL